MLSNPHLGRGIYTLPQAARLLRVPTPVLHYWIGERKDKDVASIIVRQFATERILTFAELMELHFVKLFRDEDVSFQAIRKAAKRASDKYHSDYPFTFKRFDTDGRSIFATCKNEETNKELVEELDHGQLVFKQIIRPFFKRLDYLSTNDVGRFWPLRTSSNNSGRIVLDPERRYGQPLDADTGVPTEAIRQAVTAGDGQDAKTVARWFDIPLEAVKAAMKFEKSLSS